MTSRRARALSPLVVERVRANRTPDPLTRLVICQAGHRRSCPPARARRQRRCSPSGTSARSIPDNARYPDHQNYVDVYALSHRTGVPEPLSTEAAPQVPQASSNPSAIGIKLSSQAQQNAATTNATIVAGHQPRAWWAAPAGRPPAVKLRQPASSGRLAGIKTGRAGGP